MTTADITPTKTADTVKVVVYAVIGIIIIIVIIKIYNKFFGASASDKSKKKYDQAYKDSAEEILQEQSPTMTDAAIKLLADNIHEALKYSSVSDNKGEAERYLKTVQNDADFIKLNELFGTRTEWWFGIPLNEYEFVQYVSSNLSSSALKRINDDYKVKGIQFRW